MPHPIENIISRKSANPKKVVGDITYLLMRHLHLGYREIKMMPLRDILDLVKHWNKEQKDKEKELKKHKPRRHR